MLISNSFLFIHLPKTGGTSVYSTLRIKSNPGPWRVPRNEIKHMKAKQIREWFAWWEWQKLFKFGFVRNPWDRMYSNYYYSKQIAKSSPEGNDKKTQQWIENCQKTASMEFNEYIYTNKKLMKRETAKEYFCSEDGSLLLIDNIYKYEDINNAWVEIRGKLGIRDDLLNINKTINKPEKYEDEYSQESKEIIEEAFSWEIERYGYKFNRTN